MVAVADDQGLRLLGLSPAGFGKELKILRKRLNTNVVPGEHRHLDAVRAQLRHYFAGKNLEFDLSLAPVGSKFQIRAWKILHRFPLAKRVPIPGWQSDWATEMRGEQLVAQTAPI